jgi:hypothetical protein
MSKKGSTTQVVYKNGSEARMLCRAALKKYGTVRNAARVLRMTPMEFSNQERGVRRETHAMIAALKRADLRARKAKFFKLDEMNEEVVDRISLKMIYQDFKKQFENLERLIGI